MQLIEPRTTRRSHGIALGGFALLLTVLSLAAGLAQEPQKPETRSAEDVKAEENFTRNCVKCHTADRVVGSRRTRTQWEEVMTTMQTARGAVIADEDWDVVLNFLVKHHGRVNVNRAAANELVEVLARDAGSGREYRQVPQGTRELRRLRRVCQGARVWILEKLEKLRDAISF